MGLIKMIGCYFASWSSKWTSKKEDVDIKDVESDIIYISFAKPDCAYTTGSFENTGLSFSSDFSVIAGACELLKDSKTIMLSVGGGTYGNWKDLNVDAIIALADDLYCKGIDIDWEPTDGSASAEEMGPIIEAFRSKYDGYLSFATAHVGAYGHGSFVSATPMSMYTGVNYIGLLTSGDKLDWINVMAYDAGSSFDPLECYDSYKAIFSKKIYMGVEIGDQAWGGVITTLDDVKKLYGHIKDKGDGLFVWSWLKPGPFTFQDVAQITVQQKRPIEQVDTPVIQPDKPKDTTPSLPIPDTPIFEPKLPVLDPSVTKVMWEPDMVLLKDDIVWFNNYSYKVRAGHKSLRGWEPNAAIALFVLCKDKNRDCWVSNMEYTAGEKVFHKDKFYECVISHVSQDDWQPGYVGLWK